MIVCRELGFIGWWVTSAKTGESIEEAFNFLIQKVISVRPFLTSFGFRFRFMDNIFYRLMMPKT